MLSVSCPVSGYSEPSGMRPGERWNPAQSHRSMPAAPRTPRTCRAGRGERAALRGDKEPPRCASPRSTLCRSSRFKPVFTRPSSAAKSARSTSQPRVAPGDFYQDKPIRFNPNLPVQRTDTLLGSRLVSTSYMNFAPRLGIAWSPSQKWTVRLGAGFSMPRISVMPFSTWAGTL